MASSPAVEAAPSPDEEPVCPHDLSEITVPEKDWYCNECHRDMEEGEIMYMCDPCDYGQCPECYKTKADVGARMKASDAAYHDDDEALDDASPQSVEAPEESNGRPAVDKTSVQPEVLDTSLKLSALEKPELPLGDIKTLTQAEIWKLDSQKRETPRRKPCETASSASNAPCRPAGADELRPVAGARPGGAEELRAAKLVELRGHEGCRAEISGLYAPIQGDSWAGATVYRNRRSHVYIVWHPQPPRWKVVPRKIDSTETLAYADCPTGRRTWPYDVPGPWVIVAEGGAEEADPAIECVFGATIVVVSGRSGHNQRLCGVFVEMAEDYGAFPAYYDKQKHMFIYRQRDKAFWVISNRLGPASRTGRGVVFAECEDDVPQPHLIANHWTVCAWGSRVAEVDPGISVFLKADNVREGPPPVSLTLKCKQTPAIEGSYSIRKEDRFNDQVVYCRPVEGAAPEKFLFWDGERWCVAPTVGCEAAKCDLRSQKRELQGRNHPDDAVWHGVEVLRGAVGEMDADILRSLRGKSRSIREQFT